MKTPIDNREGGFVLLTMVLIFLPLMIVVATFAMTLNMRSQEVIGELAEERALLAAEAGIDDAIFKGQTGSLTDGTSYTRNLGSGLSFAVTPTYLKSDGKDNDNDGYTDEADEDVFQVVVVGSYRNKARRLAAYLGPVKLLPTIEAAATMMNKDISLVLKGTPLISGHDKKINGTAGVGSVPGMSITPPGTTTDLDDELSASEEPKVVGTGSAPSLGTTSAIDINTLVAQLQNNANLVLTSNKYSAYNFGSGASGTTNITYRNGDVRFAGNCTGAGILVVTGDLTLSGNFRFDGVIICLGDLKNSAGTASIYGGIILGPSSGLFETKGTLNIYYSTEAISLANSLSGQYVAFNGWQELAR